jgi:hypothetical protein
MYELAEVIGDPTELGAIEATWATVNVWAEEPSWENVVGSLMWLKECDRSDAAVWLDQAITAGDVMAAKVSGHWRFLISDEDTAKVARRYWYWRLQAHGVVFLPLFHWPRENEYARQAVTAWMATGRPAPTWDQLNAMLTEEIGDEDVANQMAHNAFLCGAIEDAGEATIRFVLGDYTPFDWNKLL